MRASSVTGQMAPPKHILEFFTSSVPLCWKGQCNIWTFQLHMSAEVGLLLETDSGRHVAQLEDPGLIGSRTKPQMQHRQGPTHAHHRARMARRL